VPQPFELSGSAVVAADGTASVSLSPRGNVDLVVTGATTSVVPTSPATTLANASAAVVTINGRRKEDTSAGNGDFSDSRWTLRPADVYTCAWSGADVGARAILTLSGVQYPFGQAPPE